MLQTVFPLVNWGMGTALIVIFAIVCLGLSILVISFVMKGKSKEEYLKNQENRTEPTLETSADNSQTKD